MLSSVYKSIGKEYLFLYVDQQTGLDQVPLELLAEFGEPEWVLDVELHKGRTLATGDPVMVMNKIRQQGYYLQLPPIDSQEGR